MATSVERLRREVTETLAAIERGSRPSDLESSLIDFKELKLPGLTDRDPLRAASIDLAEAAACMANGGGGVLVVGVSDGVPSFMPRTVNFVVIGWWCCTPRLDLISSGSVASSGSASAATVCRRFGPLALL